MNENLLVSTNRTSLRPLCRNLIRGIALLASFRVTFLPGEEQFICLSPSGKRYPQAESLFKLLEGLEPASPVDELLAGAGNDLVEWLCGESGRALPVMETGLDELLQEIRRQSLFRSCGQATNSFKWFWAMWEEFYPLPQHFQAAGAGAINSSAQRDEKRAAAGEKEFAPSIGNAARSLLEVLPRDAEFVLDIGCGPGYMEKVLPADVSVLAMDIDAEALKEVDRQNCVGDITAIPLKDGAVDMVMACDVLEHLADDALQKAVSELERVSRKYIYLQVPFQEDPLMAMAYCPACRNVWHVNQHKQSFDQQRLTALVSKEWRPVCVNFTGEMSLRRKGLLEAKAIQRLGWNVHCVENAVCPNCGEKSVVVGQTERKALQHLAEFDAEHPFPAYTEIGILFCHVRQKPELGPRDEEERPRPEKRALNALVPCEGIQVQQVYTATEMLPGVYMHGCRMEVKEDRICFARDRVDTAWVAVAFPALLPRYTGIEVTGFIPEGPGSVSVSMLDAESKEFYLREWEWSGRSETYVMEKPEGYGPVYIKLYFRSCELILSSCRLIGGEDVPYWFYHKGPDRFLRFDKEHIRYSLLLAEDGSASFSHEPEDWLELTSALEQRQERALSNFARALGDTASPVCQADNRELIRHCPPAELHTGQEAEDGRGAGHRGDDARTLIIDSLVVESAAAFLGDVPRGVSPSQVPWDGRKIIIDSLFVEAIMGVCEGGRPSRIRQKAFAALRNGKRRLHGWLRRHSRLYELLISMGLKELYFKIKRRIKL